MDQATFFYVERYTLHLTGQKSKEYFNFTLGFLHFLKTKNRKIRRYCGVILIMFEEKILIQVKNLGNNTNLNYYWKLTEWRTCIQWISTSSRSFVSLIFFWYSLKCQSNIPWIANQNPGDFASNNEKTERLQIYSSRDQADSSWNSKAFTVDIKIKHRDYQAPIQKFIL